MLNQNQIIKLIDAEEFRQLIDRILANGRCQSVPARRLLGRPEIAAVSALGLALQRMVELTYAPTTDADRLANRLMAMQARNGAFGVMRDCPAELALAATAVALRGLLMWAGQQRGAGSQAEKPGGEQPGREQPGPGVENAIDHGLRALARSLHLETAEDVDARCESDSCASHGWAIVVWQLGALNEFRATVDLERILRLLNEAPDDLLEDDLSRLALAMAA